MDLVSFRLYLQRCDLAPKTRATCEFYSKTIYKHCPNLCPQEYERFLALKSTSVSTASLNKYNNAMKWILKWAKLEFPPDLLKKFREHTKPRLTLSDDEVEKILTLPVYENGDPVLYRKFTVFWHIAAYLGMRPGEVAALTTSDLNFSDHSIVIRKSKTGVGRIIKMPHILVPILSEFCKGKSGKLFVNRFGNDFTQKYWNTSFQERVDRLGITKVITPYCLRHTLATKLLQNDAALFAVQDILGHSDPKTTRVYYHGNLKAQEKALNKDTLTQKHLGAKHLIKQIEEYIDGLDLSSTDTIDYMKIMEAKKLLWESVK